MISELKAELAPFNILNDRRSYCLVELLQELAHKEIETTRVVRTSKRKERLGGSAKGLLQVLGERGWIDEAQLDRYTMDIATDGNRGEVFLEGAKNWSLKCLMANCLS